MALNIKNNELYFKNEFLGGIEQNHRENTSFLLNYCEDDFFLPEQFYKVESQDLVENLEILSKNYDILKKNGKVTLSFSRYLFLDDWDLGISPLQFERELKKKFKDNKLYTVGLSDAVEIKMAVVLEQKETVIKGIEFLEKEYQYFKDAILYENQLYKSINFSPEHFTAGTSILQYFGKLLQEKYPDKNVSVSIKQEGLKVSMTIEIPDGKKEEIEEYLNKFGMVVTNQMSVKEFALNPIQQLELETKLNAAEQEIGFQKKLLALQDKTYDENLLSLKDEVKFLREELSALRVSNNENIKLLLSSLQIKDKMIKKLSKAIENKDMEKTKTLLLELKTKDKNGYKSLKEHIDSFVVGSLTNTPSWVDFVRGIILS